MFVALAPIAASAVILAGARGWRIESIDPMGEEELFLLGEKVGRGADDGTERGRHLQRHGLEK